MGLIVENTDYNVKTDEVDLKLYREPSNSSYTLLITINREKYLNAISPNVLEELIRIFNYFDKEDNVKSIILTGKGDKAFIAGADIKAMSKYSPEEAYSYSRNGQSLVKLITNYKKPIIAAINGYALGGGCEIASACHIRYASNNAIFGQPEVKLGIMAGWGGTQNLPKLVGRSNAIDLLVSGKTIDANEAYRIGLINSIFDQDKLIHDALNIAMKINENSSNAISNTLSSILSNDYEKEAQLFRDSFKHNDSKIGIDAFLNKNKPNF
mgnify:FL=1